MHELSLMTSIVETVRQSAAAEGIRHIRTVRLVVGTRSGALPDALRFAFEVLARDVAGTGHRPGEGATPEAPPSLRGAVLEIIQPEARAECRQCGREYGISGGDWALLCPDCGASAPLLVSGNELYIDYYEGD